MTIPMWVLLAFAVWTLCVLFGSIGVYRWSRIFTGRSTIHEWRADVAQGAPWYQRAMRAHMNCVENLPVYGAVVLAAFVAGVSAPAIDVLALVFLAARVLQSIVHIGLRQTERVAALRFVLFFAQIACVIAMGALVVLRV
jgi:uncharacterized MAPEG superfamily protein